MDISSYINSLDDKIANQKNEALRSQMQLYRNFIEATIKDNNVLDKKFFIVIPFSRLELGLGGAFNANKKGLPFDENYILEKAKNALYPKRDHILRQLGRLSLKAAALTTARLAALFYDIFNPEESGFSDISLGIREYLSPMVEPAGSLSTDNSTTGQKTADTSTNSQQEAKPQ